MREVIRHKMQNPANEQLTIASIDLPSGEPVMYAIRIPHGPDLNLNFQNGPIGEVGVNGITNEALLAIVIDRLNYFQEGKYKCRENALAITKVEEALHWLHARTLERLQRGVEGTHTV
jgi:hypothetical protein